MATTDYGTFECEYCGHEAGYPSQLEIRNGKFVCRDIAACDARDAQNASKENDDG